MIDREKVIKGLEEIRDCESIVYKHRLEALEDAIAMLKAQEARAVHVTAEINDRKIGICPNCGKLINYDDCPNYCGHCGQVVM